MHNIDLFIANNLISCCAFTCYRLWAGLVDSGLRQLLDTLMQHAQLDRAGMIQVVGPRNAHLCKWAKPSSAQRLLQEKALSHMGFENFRPLQREIVTAAMDDTKSDILVQMPTNAGKTTLFALPALFDKCDKCVANPGENECTKSICWGHDVAGSAYETCRSFAIILSPLRALIADQVERLRCHYHVPTINLEIATRIQMQGMVVPMPDARDPDGEDIIVPAKLALLTPEKLTKNYSIQEELWKHHRAGRVSRIVVDEMHYVAGCDQSFRQVCARAVIVQSNCN